MSFSKTQISFLSPKCLSLLFKFVIFCHTNAHLHQTLRCDVSLLWHQMGWMLLCLLQTFLGDHCFCNSCERTCMFAFLCPLFYLEGECSLVLFIGQSHAEHLCCFLRAAYFTIYTRILLFRQRPTFSACFSPLPVFLLR